MEDVDIPTPNPFLTQWLIGEECRALVAARIEAALLAYRSIVAKRTGLLAASAHTETVIGGTSKEDRWEGWLIVSAPYAPSHEFGTGRTDPNHALAAAHDLNVVLDMMAAL